MKTLLITLLLLVSSVAGAEEIDRNSPLCPTDLQCWGDKNHAIATRLCRPLVEGQARYAYKWTDGWLEAKFNTFMWKDKKNGVLAYRTQKIQFQNGFGAWRNMSTWCGYNPDGKRAWIINIVPRR